MIRKFFKNYKVLSCCFIIAVIIVIAYIFTYDCDELFKHGGLIFNVLYNLSLAIIVNSIFTFIQVFLPNYNSEQKRKEYVVNILKDIEKEMHVFFYNVSGELKEKKIFEENDFKRLYKISMLSELECSSLNFGKFKKRKLNEWVIMETEKIEKYMNNVINILNYHIRNDILDIFNKIQRSKLHTVILNIAKTNTDTCADSFAEIKFYEEYYEYMKELESIIKKCNV